jgi:dihydrolipoamide dehydrogenase
MAQSYDTIVIGGGPGGYVAALKLAMHNQRVALVEKKHLGGTCLNVGCIPTKALLHGSELAAQIKHAGQYGINVGDIKIDLAAMIQRKDQVVKKLCSGVAGLLKARKVDVYIGQGKLTDKNTVTVELAGGKEEKLATKNIIIATGSTPAMHNIFPTDRTHVMTSDEILEVRQIPESLLIVGGGYIGCEFATLFSELGTRVVMVEMLERLLPMADADISAALTKSFKAAKIDLHCGIAVKAMNIEKNKVKTTLADGATIETNLALVCTGRRPLSADLGLEQAGVAIEKGYIKINEQCRTSIPNIFAIGDVTGKVQLAHVASRQAEVVANTIAGIPDHENYSVIPSAVYTHPEIASVGLTEEQAQKSGKTVRKATFPMLASGMATAYGETVGFVKLLADEDDVVLGAHLMCPHASDIIQEITVLMKSECTLDELHATIHGHPTFAEAVAEAVETLRGHPLHSM